MLLDHIEPARERRDHLLLSLDHLLLSLDHLLLFLIHPVLPLHLVEQHGGQLLVVNREGLSLLVEAHEVGGYLGDLFGEQSVLAFVIRAAHLVAVQERHRPQVQEDTAVSSHVLHVVLEACGRRRDAQLSARGDEDRAARDHIAVDTGDEGIRMGADGSDLDLSDFGRDAGIGDVDVVAAGSLAESRVPA